MKHLKPNKQIEVIGSAIIDSGYLRHIILFTNKQKRIVYRNFKIDNDKLSQISNEKPNQEIFIEGILHRYESKRLLSELEIIDWSFIN